MSAPSWHTIEVMEQARWRRTAEQYATELPAELAALAEVERLSPAQCAALGRWCAEHGRPPARAGGGGKDYAPRKRKRRR